MWLCDASQILSNQWCASQWAGLGAPGSAITSGGDYPSPLYPMLQAGDGAVELRTVPVFAEAGLQVEYFDDGTALVTAGVAQAGRVSYEVWAAGSLLGTVEDVYGFGGVQAEQVGAASIVLDGVSVSASGTVSAPGAVTGSADILLDGVLVSASGALGAPPAVTGDVSAVLDGVSVAAGGAVLVRADADIELADIAVTASGRLAGVAPPIVLRDTAPRGARGANLQRAARRNNQ